MNTKTIQTPKGLIVWDSFRGSFTMLMNTVPLLLECKIAFDMEGYAQKPKLLFVAHETNGLQEDTRKVVMESSFRSNHKVDFVNDTVLVEEFNSFYDEYISYKEQLAERAKMNQEISSAIDNLVTKPKVLFMLCPRTYY